MVEVRHRVMEAEVRMVVAGHKRAGRKVKFMKVEARMVETQSMEMDIKGVQAQSRVVEACRGRNGEQNMNTLYPAIVPYL